ncbi:unnamed protein product [Knipowitschia caucasica]
MTDVTRGSAAVDDVGQRFRDQFFSMTRVASLPWTIVEDELERSKSTDIISQILNQTCCHPLCSEFPPSVRYRRVFICELIKRLEASCCDSVDLLYDALAAVIGEEEAVVCYKSYFLPGGGAVTLQENVAMVSQGTTGLVTWEASLYLAEWALDHQQYFRDRRVLELGSGSGLTGITICSSCSPSSFTFSDVHPKVLNRLEENLTLNHLQNQVSVVELDWASVTEEQLRDLEADTIIAADVVYDPEVVVHLVSLLSRILSSTLDVFICSTIRNPDTYRDFKQQLDAAGILQVALSAPVRTVFPYSRESHIEMIKLHKNT